MPTHHNTVKGILACLLCIVLSACAGTATVPPLTRTPQITAATTPEKTTPTNFPATPQQVPTTSQSLQTSHTPTPAPRLSATPAAGSQTSVVSLNPRAILTEQAYQLAIELTATQIANFPVTCDDSQQNYITLSPGGNWLALSCGDSHDQTLEIVNRDGRHWVVQFKDFLPEKNIQNVGTPVGGLFPIQWTNHDDFLYFSSFIGGDSQGLCFNNSGSFGLYRINLKDGTTSTTLPLNPSGYAYEFTFSPGGRRLAYIYPEYFIFDWFSGQLTTVTPTPEPH